MSKLKRVLTSWYERPGSVNSQNINGARPAEVGSTSSEDSEDSIALQRQRVNHAAIDGLVDDEEAQNKDAASAVQDDTDIGHDGQLQSGSAAADSTTTTTAMRSRRVAAATNRWHPPREKPVTSLEDHTNHQHLPIFLSRILRWLACLPIIKSICTFIAGPPHSQCHPPRMWRIYPLERIERLLVRFTRYIRYPWALWIFLLAWFLGTCFLTRAAWYNGATGSSSSSWVSGGTAYWQANDACGLYGNQCGPFQGFNASYRCPSNQLSVKLLNNRAVGIQEVFYKPLVVGGGDELGTYRADSWLCAAAIHHGVFSDGNGGCLTIQAVGNYTNFIPSTANGVSSIGFPSTFPFAYRFLPVSQTDCKDLRNGILIWNVVMSAAFGFLMRTTAGVWYWVCVCFGYWQITLASDPRDYPPLLADAFGSFLPALFVCYAFYRFAFRWVLPAFNDKIFERTILFLGPYWVSILTNYTFDQLPVDRLTAADIRQTPNGVITVVIIAVVVFCVAVNQIRVVRTTGWLPYYLGYYALGGAVILILSQLPGFVLRIHHYIIAIVLLPGTAFPTRFSLVYQGILLGLFINGIARWDFDSILQTPAQLQRDAPLGSDLPSFNLTSTIDTAMKLVTWSPIPSNLTASWNGFALIVNDVLVYTGSNTTFAMTNYSTTVPWFLRLAYQQNGASGDFTRAAIAWLGNGTWIPPAAGAS